MAHLTPAGLRSYAERGWFIVRGLVDREVMAEIRRRIVACVSHGGTGANPVLEAGARTSAIGGDPYRNLRKLGAFSRTDRAAWLGWQANPDVLELLRTFIGDDIVMKYDSVFLKPARVGGATPWHQDPALWRHDDPDAMNGWLAVDRSDQENGCLQVVSGSHVWPITPHLEYPDGVHVELPRERCVDLKVDHIELDPGDALFWHNNLWHHSPPNTSDRDRIGMGAVWTTPAFAATQPDRRFYRVMDAGRPIDAFPPIPSLCPSQAFVPAHAPRY